MSVPIMNLLSPTSPKPSKSYPRDELEEMKRLWLAANVEAEKSGDWVSTLGALYHDDAIYRWNVGPNEEFIADGLSAIKTNAIGIQMEGFHGWSYPYDRFLIDPEIGEMVGFWRQVAPVKRADGTTIEVAGCGGSWFQYGGDFKWSWQRDFFDFGNVLVTLSEVAALNGLTAPVKQKMHQMARGNKLVGHVPLGPSNGLGGKIKQGAALAKVLLTGR